MGFLAAARAAQPEESLDSDDLSGDDLAPDWMVEEAARRSSHVISGDALVATRRKLSRMSKTDLMELMVPMEETDQAVTARDFGGLGSSSKSNSDSGEEVEEGGTGDARTQRKSRRREKARRNSALLFAPEQAAAVAAAAAPAAAAAAAAAAASSTQPPPPPPADEAPPPPPVGATPPPPTVALEEVTEDQVQNMLRMWGLECFAEQFAEEHTDGAALGDITELEDLEDFTGVNRRQQKKLIRLINGVRTNGVELKE